MPSKFFLPESGEQLLDDFDKSGADVIGSSEVANNSPVEESRKDDDVEKYAFFSVLFTGSFVWKRVFEFLPLFSQIILVFAEFSMV